MTPERFFLIGLGFLAVIAIMMAIFGRRSRGGGGVSGEDGRGWFGDSGGDGGGGGD